ncbi:hypothetical protein SELMODRAFT_31034, partial [Selaginella moellendorffii]
FLSNLVLQMYGKCGSVEDAKVVFENTAARNSFSWTMLVTAYAQNGYAWDAYRLLELMPERNRDLVSWTAMLAAFCSNEDISAAKNHFDRMPKHSVVAWNELVKATITAGMIEEGRALFHRIPQPDSFSWTSAIASLAQRRHFAAAEELFAAMPEQLKDTVAHTAMLRALLSSGAIDRAKAVFDAMERRDGVAWATMLQGFAQRGRRFLEDAERVFLAMPCRNSFSYTTMVAGFCEADRIEQAQSLFWAMPERDVVAWTVLLAAIGRADHLPLSRVMELFDSMPERNVLSWNALLGACSRGERDLDCARSVFLAMPQRDRGSWNAVLAGHAQIGEMERALEIFQSMEEKDAASYTAMVAGFARASNLGPARELFDQTPHKDIVAWNTILAAFAQAGHLSQALEIFDNIPRPNLTSWNAIIAGFAHSHCGQSALQHFHSMLLHGIKADATTFSGVLRACSHTGLLEEASSYFVLLARDLGVRPGREQYQWMVDIVSRLGQLELAEELIKAMPFFPNDVAWGSLLTACGTQGDLERAKRISSHAVAADAKNSGRYVAFANVVA